jgi:hypothetical protein
VLNELLPADDMGMAAPAAAAGADTPVRSGAQQLLGAAAAAWAPGPDEGLRSTPALRGGDKGSDGSSSSSSGSSSSSSAQQPAAPRPSSAEEGLSPVAEQQAADWAATAAKAAQLRSVIEWGREAYGVPGAATGVQPPGGDVSVVIWPGALLLTAVLGLRWRGAACLYTYLPACLSVCLSVLSVYRLACTRCYGPAAQLYRTHHAHTYTC